MTHNVLGTLISSINQEKASRTCLQANLILSVRFPLPMGQKLASSLLKLQAIVKPSPRLLPVRLLVPASREIISTDGEKDELPFS